MKLVKVGFKKPVIQVDNNGKLMWMNCVDNKEHNTTGQGLYEYIKKNFKTGDDIVPEYKEEKGNYYCNRVSQGKTNVTEQIQESKKETEKIELPKVSVPVKTENKYQYEYPRGYMSPKTPEESLQIKKLSLIDSVAQIVSGMLNSQVGSIDGNSVIAITKVYIKEVFDELNKIA